jgi:hypothetical protein
MFCCSQKPAQMYGDSAEERKRKEERGEFELDIANDGPIQREKADAPPFPMPFQINALLSKIK